MCTRGDPVYSVTSVRVDDAVDWLLMGLGCLVFINRIGNWFKTIAYSEHLEKRNCAAWVNVAERAAAQKRGNLRETIPPRDIQRRLNSARRVECEC